VETFTELKEFVENPAYHQQRLECINNLDLDIIDPPIVDLISGLSRLPYCFTLQSCYGHFLYEGQQSPRNVEPLPVAGDITTVEYRIAYLALCIRNDDDGRMLHSDLSKLPEIDPAYVQWACAEWFWETHLNSYILQVEPDRYKDRDSVTVDYHEALHIEKTRNEFFSALTECIQKRLN